MELHGPIGMSKRELDPGKVWSKKGIVKVFTANSNWSLLVDHWAGGKRG